MHANMHIKNWIYAFTTLNTIGTNKITNGHIIMLL
jgi:hypothetical protein